MAEETAKKIPISEFYKTIDNITIYKSRTWWEAIVVYESYGKRPIGPYLWVKRNGAWKIQHKFDVRNMDEWNKLKNAIERLAPKLVSQ